MSKSNRLEIVSQFNEDAIASMDMHCQHPSCGIFIPKGAPCYYIATIDPAKPGRHVCKSCLAWYSQKLATGVRTQGEFKCVTSFCVLICGAGSI